MVFEYDTLCDSEHNYFEFVKILEDTKDRNFDSFQLELENHWRGKDRYGIEYNSYVKKFIPNFLIPFPKN